MFHTIVCMFTLIAHVTSMSSNNFLAEQHTTLADFTSNCRVPCLERGQHVDAQRVAHLCAALSIGINSKEHGVRTVTSSALENLQCMRLGKMWVGKHPHFKPKTFDTQKKNPCELGHGSSKADGSRQQP